MGTLPLVLHLWTLWMVWLLIFFSFATSFTTFENWDDPSIVYTYNRFAEIQDKCGAVLSLASELEPNDDRSSRIKKELSFVNGDWDQESGRAPLIPLDDREMQRNHAGHHSFLKLASFWVVDIDSVRRGKNMVSVSGIMEIGMTRNQPFNYRPGWSPKFRMDPGFSSMTILFEGVYIESDENGGERLICLLGNSTMPTTNKFTDTVELADRYGYKLQNQPPHIEDDQIMLVLRYNKNFNLTTGNVSGEMKSLHEKSNFKYFDRIHISSLLGLNSKYQFGAEELLPKACSPYPYQDNLVDNEVILFKDDNFCGTLQCSLSNGFFNIVPSWKSVGSNVDANRLGPFVLSRKSKAIDEGSNNFRLLVQNLHCYPGFDENNIKTARVFALFRVIHSWEDGYTSESRTGLSGMTLSAEGMWRSSEGQLCMVGCLGIVGTTSERCNSRICLHFPLTFSINQRSTAFGTITSINDTESYTPLWFEKVTSPEVIISGEYERNAESKLSYKYSKIMQAKAFQMRSKLSFLGTLVRKSMLVYPSLNDDGIASLSLLADELSLRVSVASNAFPEVQAQGISVELQVLSLGSYFERYRSRRHGSYQEVEKSSDSNAETIETSGHLRIYGKYFNNISLSFEGIYDSTVGKMYLVGCRDVRINQMNIKEEMNLERGMDCLFEVKVEYTPRNTRWLKNSEVRISISSKRTKEDPLYSNPVSFKTEPIAYDTQFAYPDVIFRKNFEKILRVLMLVMAIVCTGSQLHYVNSFVDPIAFISLVMIYIPVVDYVGPLMSTGEIFFKWKGFQSFSYQTNDIEMYERFNVLDYIIKVLSLFALLLTLNLGKKVFESRTRQIGHGHKQQSRLPNEKKIILITSAVHLIGFLIIREIHSTIGVEMAPPDKFIYRRSMLLELVTELDVYLGVVPDLFLLPQIVANTLWQNKGKPLRKLYYLGLTSLRVFSHVYDYIRDPVPDHNYGGHVHYRYTKLDLHSKFGNIVVTVIATLLAVVVYKQQKRMQKVKAEENEDAALKSELNESLLS